MEFGRDDFSLVRAEGEACLGELRQPVELPRLSSSMARLLGSSMILDSIPMLFKTPGDIITYPPSPLGLRNFTPPPSGGVRMV